MKTTKSAVRAGIVMAAAGLVISLPTSAHAVDHWDPGLIVMDYWRDFAFPGGGDHRASSMHGKIFWDEYGNASVTGRVHDQEADGLGPTIYVEYQYNTDGVWQWVERPRKLVANPDGVGTSRSNSANNGPFKIRWVKAQLCDENSGGRVWCSPWV
ncbi:hypothetical protein ACFQVC_42180 [Streptomyces monticola]|uniref:Secreted protein n=1 Tax=Streptomyces monticola TaxID=2666263 RepID=A0ABW2JZ62_9ACTN